MQDVKPNPEMLLVAREYRGKTQNEIAKAAGIQPPRLSRIEAGIYDPSPEELGRLAEALEFPVRFFFQTERRYGASRYHRKRRTLSAKQLIQMTAMLNIYRYNIARLFEHTGLSANYAFPQYDSEDYGHRAAQIAQMTREWLGISNEEPVSNLTRTLESSGCIIIRCKFGSAKFDGMSQQFSDLPPLIFLNSEMDGARMRFTLAHELGHIVMHCLPVDDPESEADAFASEFLVPASKATKQLKHSLTIPYLCQLKQYWKVSLWCLIKRASDLGTIKENAYRYLCVRLNQYGFRGHDEPIQLDPERPSFLTRAFEHLRDKLAYKLDEVCTLLSIHPDDFATLYPEQIALFKPMHISQDRTLQVL